MESIYKEWLQKNNEENERARKQFEQLHQVVQGRSSPLPNTAPIPSTSISRVSPIPSTSTTDPVPSTSRIAVEESALSDIFSEQFIPTNPSDIVYQKDGLELIVEKGMFQRQKKFSLQALIKL